MATLRRRSPAAPGAALHTLITVGVQFNLFQFIPAVVGLNPVQTAISVMPFTLAQLAVLLLLVKRQPQFPLRYLLQSELLVRAVGIALLVAAIRPPVTALGLLPALVVMGLVPGYFPPTSLPSPLPTPSPTKRSWPWGSVCCAWGCRFCCPRPSKPWKLRLSRIATKFC